MSMWIRGVTFDLEGTVVDLEEIHRRAWADTVHFYDASVDFDMVPEFLGSGDRAVAKYLQGVLGVGADVLIAKKRQIFLDSIEQMACAPRDGWVSVFQRIQRFPKPVAVGSLTARAQALLLLERSGISSMIPQERCIFQEDVVNLKPAPDVFLKTAERLAIEPRNQLVFEDSSVGVQAAVRAGSVAVVAVPVYFEQTSAELYEAGAIAVYRDWAEVSRDLARLLLL